MLTFTELRQHIRATYPERSPAFHFIAARYYAGAETPAGLQQLAQPRPVADGHYLHPLITADDAETIIRNR